MLEVEHGTSFLCDTVVNLPASRDCPHHQLAQLPCAAVGINVLHKFSRIEQPVSPSGLGVELVVVEGEPWGRGDGGCTREYEVLIPDVVE